MNSSQESAPFALDALPEIVLIKILENLTYDQVAKMRIISCYFNRICKQHLNRGFQRVDRLQSQYLKELKAKLPRRESARRNHPYARHCDILTAIDTRMNLLSMTFGKYMDANLCCFIPGKIMDEIYNVLRILKNTSPSNSRDQKDAPRTYEVLQELRDISSMAMEHFDDKVVPGLIRRHQQASSSSSGSGTSSPMVNLGPSRLLSSPGAAALFVASSPSTSSGNVIANPALAPHQKVMRDEFLALKKKMSEVMGKHKSARKEQNEKIENLQRTVNAQAALISSQTEMLKEINKKLLENEQKFADFLHAKGMASSPTKRPLPSVMTSPTDDGEQIENASSAPPTKKFKPIVLVCLKEKEL